MPAPHLHPNGPGIGIGPHTSEKQRILTAFCGQIFAILAAIVRKHPWASPRLRVLDITAGTGRHPETGEPGSASIILAHLEDLRIRAHVAYQFFPIELEPQNFAALCDYINAAFPAAVPYVIPHQGDHAEQVPHIVRRYFQVKPRCLGFLYYDFTTSDFHHSLSFLGTIDQYPALRYFDVLIYVSAARVKGSRAAFPDRNKPDLERYLKRIGKKKWFLTAPRGAHQWTFLYGTNYENFHPDKASGLVDKDTTTGNDIWQNLQYSHKERNGEHNGTGHNGATPTPTE